MEQPEGTKIAPFCFFVKLSKYAMFCLRAKKSITQFLYLQSTTRACTYWLKIVPGHQSERCIQCIACIASRNKKNLAKGLSTTLDNTSSLASLEAMVQTEADAWTPGLHQRLQDKEPQGSCRTDSSIQYTSFVQSAPQV